MKSALREANTPNICIKQLQKGALNAEEVARENSGLPKGFNLEKKRSFPKEDYLE